MDLSLHRMHELQFASNSSDLQVACLAVLYKFLNLLHFLPLTAILSSIHSLLNTLDGRATLFS